jgi:predicted nicotinamide N-methyase
LNAQANNVAVDATHGDLLDGDGDGAEVVLAGDVFYSPAMAERMLPFLQRAVARGARVLVGDPGRDYLPQDRLGVVASYQVSMLGAPEDAQISRAYVLELRR